MRQKQCTTTTGREKIPNITRVKWGRKNEESAMSVLFV
jgi:hypothetical protein